MAPGVPPARYRLSQIQARKSRKVRWIRTSIPEIEAIFSDQRTDDRILAPGEHGSKENSLLVGGPCLLRGVDHLVLELERQLLIVTELLGVDSAPASQGAKLAGVAVEFLGRSLRVNDLKTTPGIHSHDLASAAGQVPDNLSHTVLRDTNLE